MKQFTFMMLKPDAFIDGKKDKVIETLQNHGLIVESSQKVEVTMDIMKILLDHYQPVIDSKGKDINFTGKLFNTFYYDGPNYVMPMIISYEGEEDIISYSRRLVGKTNPVQAEDWTIRGHFSQDSYEKSDAEERLVNNIIHASDSQEAVAREMKIWEKYLCS